MTTRHFLAVDLGATSGRTIVGTLSQGRFSMCELTRFDNRLLTAGNHVYWDLPTLYAEVLNGLAEAARRNIAIESIGIDTWGVDFVLFASDGTPLGNPLAYRDPHTSGIQPRYFNKVLDKDTVYQTTGIQFMDFNTLFQLYALREAGNELLDRAEKLLFMSDALAYIAHRAGCVRIYHSLYLAVAQCPYGRPRYPLAGRFGLGAQLFCTDGSTGHRDGYAYARRSGTNGAGKHSRGGRGRS